MELLGIDLALKRKDITRQELADYLNVTPSGLSKYIRGDREAPYAILKKMCQYLDLSISSVLGEAQDVKSIPEDELQLLERYRKLSPDGKEIIRAKALELILDYPAVSKKQTSVI